MPAVPESASSMQLTNGHSKNGFAHSIRKEVKNSLVSDIKDRLRQDIESELKDDLLAHYQRQILDEIRDDVKGDILAELKHELQLKESLNPARLNGSSAAAEPPPSIFTPICHPLVEQATADVDGYYLQHWPFPNEKARKKFVAAGFSRVTCLYFPKALNERIRFACSLLTILFLIDDQLEDMSLADGKAYNESLMPLCRGDVKPDRSVPVQWMMYDLWVDMRKCDKELADEVLEPVFNFMRAQTASERLTISAFGKYLEYRQADVGQALLAALMRFSMALRLSPSELVSVTPVDMNTGRHIAIINDIYSYEKELLSSKTGHAEGGYLCSGVPIFSRESNIPIPAAKRVLYELCRAWEVEHRELVARRESAQGGCSVEVSKYMEGLEYHMSGNERWSRETRRYSEVY